MNEITQFDLERQTYYDINTGFFTWRSCMGIEGGRSAERIHPDKYPCISLNNVEYASDRLAWLYVTATLPDKVEHINGNIADNRWINLDVNNEKQQEINWRNEMILNSTLKGIIEDGRNSKMGQVAIADKYGVGQTTVNRIFKLHDIRVKVKIKQVFTFKWITQSECGFRYELYENDVFLKYSRFHSTYKKALKSGRDVCSYWNKKVHANSDLFIDNEGSTNG